MPLYFYLVWKDSKASVPLMLNTLDNVYHCVLQNLLSSLVDLTKKLFKFLALRWERKGAGFKNLLVSECAYKNYIFLRIKKLKFLKLGLYVTANGISLSSICFPSFSLIFLSDLKALLICSLITFFG